MYHPTILYRALEQWCSGPPGPPQSAPVAPGPIDPDKAPPLKVLIVEDEVLIAMTLESMVEDFGYEVCGVACAGDDAVRQAARSRPDVILMDINLGPGIDGIEAARRTREALSPRIVFVSAYGDPATLARVRVAVPEAVMLNKPFDSDGLLRAIQRTAR